MTDQRERTLFREIHGANTATGLPYLCSPKKWPIAAAMEFAGWLEGKVELQPAPEAGGKGYVVTDAGVAAYNAGLPQ